MREGDTPLIHAARHDRVADVVALLADGADVNETKANASAEGYRAGRADRDSECVRIKDNFVA